MTQESTIVPLTVSGGVAPLVSIVIPVFRSRDSLYEIAERVAKCAERGEIRYELIFVDDGSPKESWEAIQALHARYPKVVTGVQLARNFGQHNAIMCGFRMARGDVIVTIDDDLQTPPEEIPKLLQALDAENLDLVYGVPVIKQHALGRNLGSQAVNAFYRRIFRTHVTVTSFRAIRRELVDAILSYDLNFTFIDGLLAWNSQRIGTVSVEHLAREEGRSGYSLSKLLTLALNLFTNFSILPLQIASGAGLLASLFGITAGMIFLIQGLLGSTSVPGYASTIVAIMVLGGLQLLAIGVIGEYVGRLHLNVNRKPQYTVRTLLSACDAASSNKDTLD